ncbi:MAG: hypothetical protein SFW64_08895 [Alphaproteobacteria bacterium]|nr:hypothetical protein [Alphaproteobacteria bacterium]
MRACAPALLLLAACLGGPALAQPAAAGDGRSLTADGKIRIGYDKRADYPALRTRAGTGKATPADKSGGEDAGDIFDSVAAEGKTAPKPAAAEKAPVAPPAFAKTLRDDSALRSDSSHPPTAPVAAKPDAPAPTGTVNAPAPNTNTNTNANNGGGGNSYGNGYAVVGGKVVRLP